MAFRFAFKATDELTDFSIENVENEKTIADYIKEVKKLFAQNKDKDATILFCEAMKIAEKQGTDNPEGLLDLIFDSTVISDVFSYISSEMSSSSKKIVSRLAKIEQDYLLYCYEHQKSLNFKQSRDELMEELCFTYRKYAHMLSDVGNLVLAEYFFLQEKKILEDKGNKGNEYEACLGDLSVFYQTEVYNYKMAGEFEYLIFKNRITRCGLKAQETLDAFTNFATTISIPYCAKSHKIPIIDNEACYKEDCETSIACLKRYREILFEVKNKFGKKYYQELEKNYFRIMREYEDMEYSLDEDDFLLDSFLIEPCVYLFHNKLIEAQDAAFVAIEYVFHNQPDMLYYGAYKVTDIFDEYDYPMFSLEIWKLALRQAIYNKDESSSELIEAAIANTYYRLGDLESAYKIASEATEQFNFKNADSYIQNMITLSNIAFNMDLHRESMAYARAADAVLHNRIPEIVDVTLAKGIMNRIEPSHHVRVWEKVISSAIAREQICLNQFSQANHTIAQNLDNKSATDNATLLSGDGLSIGAQKQKAFLAYSTGNYEESMNILRGIYQSSYYKLNPDPSILDDLVTCAWALRQADTLNKYLNLYIQDDIRSFIAGSSEMTEAQRYDYWEADDNSHDIELFGMFCYALGEKTNDSYYNLALAYKEFLLHYSTLIEKNVNNSGDSALINSYKQYKEAVQSNADNVQDLESYCMHLYSLHTEFYNAYSAPKWQNVQDKLSRNSVAIEFVRCYGTDVESNCYNAIIVDKTCSIPKLIKLCSENDLNSLAVRFQELSKKPDKRNAEGSDLLFNDYYSELYRLIWSNLKSELNGKEDIFFSAHGILEKMNIEVALDEKKRPICDSYKLHRLSSTLDINKNDKSVDLNHTVLFGGLNYNKSSNEDGIFSKVVENISRSHKDELLRTGWDYLDGARIEVESIDQLLSSNGIYDRLFTSDDGTESAFKSLSGNIIPVLHIATHGFYYNSDENEIQEYLGSNSEITNPMKRSGLILSGGEDTWKGRVTIPSGKDNILLSEEILGMDLRETRLVILSACQTALGDINGNGVYGLRRAFKLAGAQSIIMSLWEVDDEGTRIMMENIYKYLLKGYTIRQSFEKSVQSVKLWNNNPYYWSSFILLE